MADWPDLDSLKRALDVSSEDFDVELGGVLASAISQVKLDVGDWDEDDDEPDESLAEAARLLAVRMAKAPGETPRDSARDADYERHLQGHRRSFGVA